MSSNYVSDFNESCADCAYHHCKMGCKKGKKECTGGECLVDGKSVKCYNKRCDKFKEWHKE